MKRYIALKPITIGNKTYAVGMAIPHEKLDLLTETQRKQDLYIQDYADSQLTIPYGAIFYSSEYPFPGGENSLTCENMEKNLCCSRKPCCKEK